MGYGKRIVVGLPKGILGVKYGFDLFVRFCGVPFQTSRCIRRGSSSAPSSASVFHKFESALPMVSVANVFSLNSAFLSRYHGPERKPLLDKNTLYLPLYSL